MPLLMPITHLVHPPTQHPSSNSVCSLSVRVFCGLLPSLFLSYFFSSLPLYSSVMLNSTDWLILLSIITLAPSTLLQIARFHSFWSLSNIPFVCACVCTYVYIHTHTHTYIYIYTHHIFFIHSSVNGHLGSSHKLASVDSAAVNIGVHVLLRINIFVFFG